MNKNKSPEYICRLAIPAIVLSALYIMAGMIPLNSLWGFNFLKYFPQYVLGIYTLLILFIIYPYTANKIVAFLSRLSCSFQKLSIPVRIIIISLIAGVIFYLLRVHVHSLGDGYQRVYEIEKGLIYYHTEPLDFYIHAIFYRLLLLLDINSAELSYVITSILSGVVFVNAIYLYKFPEQVNSMIATLTKILILASGGLQIYFGYVESYSLYYMFSLLFLLYSLKYLISGRGLIKASILISLAIASHITASFLLPGFIYLAYLNLKNGELKSFREKYLAPLIVGTVILALIIQEISRQFIKVAIETPYSGLLLPLFKVNEYSLFSPQHLYDILNQILLIAPYSFLILALLIPAKRVIKYKGSFAIFLFILIISALLFMLLIDPKLGYARDWDLFSTPAGIIGLSLSFLLLFGKGMKQISKYNAFVIGSLSILLLSGWILTNSSAQKQLGRAHDLLGLSDKGSQYCTELLAYYYKHELKDNQKAIELYQSIDHYENNARLCKKMGDALKDLGRFNEAEKYYKNALVEETFNSSLLNKIGQVFIAQRRYDTALVVLRKAHRLAPDTASIIEALALTYIHKKEYDKALSYADTLVSLDKHSPGASLIKLTVAAWEGDWQSARLHYLEFLKYGQGRSDYETMRDFYKDLE